MEIKRFDEIEFDVLQCGHRGGYYPKDERAARAIVLMEEGIFIHNPRENWKKTGWKFTDFGKEYYEFFMNKVREKHGHVWMTKIEVNPDLYDEDEEYANKIDTFAYSSGYHNGMRCKNCGFEFCIHCDAEIEIASCIQGK